MKRTKGDALPLKESQVKNFAPPPEAAEAKLFDANTALVLRANRSQKDATKITKHWLHRHIVDGKKRYAPIGTYPKMSIAQAREASKNWMPTEKTSATAALTTSTPAKGYAAMSFGDVVDTYIAKTRKPSTTKTWLNIAETYLTSEELRKRPAPSITPADAWQIIETARTKRMVREKAPRGVRGQIIGEIPKKPTPGVAEKLFSLLHAAFASALAQPAADEKIYINPFGRIRDHDVYEQEVTNRKTDEPRALTLTEIPKVWCNLNKPHGHGTPVAARALMLMLVTGQRPTEVASLRRSEILPPDEDGDRWWRIPPEKIKTCKMTKKNKWSPHFVYLSPLALRIIGDGDGDIVFPSRNTHGEITAYDAHSLISLINKPREGRVAKEKWVGAFEAWSPNDLRKTVQTTLELTLKCPAEISAAMLNHDIRTKIRKIYTVINDDTYRFDKKEWFTRWAEWLEQHIGREHTTTIRNEDPPKYDIETLTRLVADGLSNRAIAEQFGAVSETAIRMLRKKYGIAPLKERRAPRKVARVEN